jgi:ABC-type sugar transport system ATPase subunit
LSFVFTGGSTHVLIGENGSGKSTLVKMLAGVLEPDQGKVMVAGQALRRFSPRAAINAGIATCFQEVLVEDNLTVLENIFLGDKGWVRPRTSMARRAERADATLHALSEAPPHLGDPVAQLGLAQRQLVVIARALCQEGARAYLLDEATAALDRSDAERVLGVFAGLAAAGSVVILTTHRLEEIERIGDHIVVLRNGAMSGVLDRSAVSESRILELMSKEADLAFAARKAASKSAALSSAIATASGDQAIASSTGRGIPVLAVRGVSIRERAREIDLEIFSGEVTGIAGLDGHGQAALLRFLGGIERPRSGRVEVLRRDGIVAQIGSQRDALSAGVVYVPRERKAQGLFPKLSVLDNFALPTLGHRSRLGFVGTGRGRRAFRPLAERLMIRAASLRAPITSLSGGNQQKVLIARWLAADPDVVLLDDPTRGVDMKTKADLYVLLRELAISGRAVVMVSTELKELVELCDRVVVMYRLAVAADLRRVAGARIGREELLAAMFGRRR